jgi:hypothetical protein
MTLSVSTNDAAEDFELVQSEGEEGSKAESSKETLDVIKAVNHRLGNLERDVSSANNILILETKLKAEAGTVDDDKDRRIENLEAKANEIKEQVALLIPGASFETLEKETDALEQERLAHVARALNECIGFTYKQAGVAGKQDVSALVRKIISEFGKGFHYVLPLNACVLYASGRSVSQFRTKIEDIVHGLTGVKPRLKQSGPVWTIHYS